MKNVMTKAWEIAREGAKKFGGSAKDYFAQALRMAWAIIKKGVNKLEIGYREYAKKDGLLWFVTNEVEGLQVGYLKEEKNLYNNKKYIKCIDFTNDYKKVQDKDGNKFRMYHISIFYGDIQLKLGDTVQVVKNTRS